jgi:hypothetical protein
MAVVGIAPMGMLMIDRFMEMVVGMPVGLPAPLQR